MPRLPPAAFLPSRTLPARLINSSPVPKTTCNADQVTVTYRGESIPATRGEKLRTVLLRARAPLHNGGLLITCKGIGTCGTCAVAVQGTVTPAKPSWREQARLSFPPHTATNSESKNLRLACQVRVSEHIVVNKFSGFWGHTDEQL